MKRALHRTLLGLTALAASVAGPAAMAVAEAPPQRQANAEPPDARLAEEYLDCVFHFDFLDPHCQPVITIGCLTTEPDCADPPPVGEPDEQLLAIARGLEHVAAKHVGDTGLSRRLDSHVVDEIIPLPVLCAGKVATIVGTAGSDFIIGTNGADVIAGLSGNDHVFGLDGSDLICAGSGNDYVDAGTGNDVVYGQDGHDQLFGSRGRDWLNGEAGNDGVVGGSGPDTHIGETGSDRIRAVYQDDASPDFVDAGTDEDWVDTRDGVGNDSGTAGAGPDHCLVDGLDTVASC